MGMGIVSDKDFLKESSKLQIPEPIPMPTNSTTIEPLPTKGRGEGNIGVPNALRNIIGTEAIDNGRQSAVHLAENFGISPSSVSAYSNGATSTSSYEGGKNVGVINKAKERISKRARGKLMLALTHITEDKLQGTNAKDLAGIAKDMSAVVKHMEPEVEKNPAMNNNGPTFVFYAPQFRDERFYDTVVAKE